MLYRLSLPLLAAGLLWPASPAAAARKPRLKFLRTTDLPELGIRLRLMDDARELPPAPPKAYTYQVGLDPGSPRKDLFNPVDLWRQREHAGRWTDEDGNTLVLAAINTPFPADLPRQHVTTAEFDAAVEAARPKWTPWTAAHLEAWAAIFLGARRVQLEKIRRPPSRFRDLFRCRPAGHPRNHYAYAFRLSRQAVGQYFAPDTWFFAFVAANPAIDPEDALEEIEDSFLPSITLSRRRSDDTRSRSSFQNRSVAERVTESAEFLQSRRRAEAGIRNMKDWWSAETPHYIFLSNLGSRDRVLVKDLQAEIEYLHAAYIHSVPPRKPIREVSVIRIFAAADEYAAYVPAEYRWTGGVWAPQRQELVIRPPDATDRSAQRQRLREVIYHEAFHQYLFYALDRTQAAPWFNEGHAAFFQHASIRGRRLTIEENEEWADALEERGEERPLPVRRLLSMSYAQFYDRVPNRREQNYALAWGLIYYLRKGLTRQPLSPYREVLGRYLDALWETRDPMGATGEAFRRIDIDKLEKDLAEFWNSNRERSRAERHRLYSVYDLD